MGRKVNYDEIREIDILVSWVGHGFGDPLVLALATRILTDNGVNAEWKRKGVARPWMVDCAIWQGGPYKQRYRGKYDQKDPRPSFVQHLETLERMCGKKLKVDYNYVPVNFTDIPDTPSVDVLMCTECGDWSPYRNWPYFDELKQRFDEEGITYADIQKDGLWSMICLNYAKRCKLYLGLDTGVSHYVSKFVNGKTLIINGGYLAFDFWAYLYDYDCIQIEDMDCRPCGLDRRFLPEIACKNNHKCMRDITPEMVFKAVKERV